MRINMTVTLKTTWHLVLEEGGGKIALVSWVVVEGRVCEITGKSEHLMWTAWLLPSWVAELHSHGVQFSQGQFPAPSASCTWNLTKANAKFHYAQIVFQCINSFGINLHFENKHCSRTDCIQLDWEFCLHLLISEKIYHVYSETRAWEFQLPENNKRSRFLTNQSSCWGFPPFIPQTWYYCSFSTLPPDIHCFMDEYLNI